MAKKSTAAKSAKSNTTGIESTLTDTSTVSDRFLYYDKLHFIPTEDKDEVWAAQVLAFVKRNAVEFVNPKLAEEMRKLDRGEIDAAEYKKMIDPILPDGKGGTTGGEALYFHADWKACPIFVHLDNILEAKIKQIPLNLTVTASDQFAMSKKQKENSKIIGSQIMRNFINEFNVKLGYPKLTKFDDPFNYVKKLQQGYVPPQKVKGFKLNANLNSQPPTSLIDSLKAAIDDNESLALFNDFIYKDGTEIACEIGLKYYMIQTNKFQNKSRKLVADLKNFNALLLRFYTSQTTGRPIIEYKDVARVRTLPFVEEDLSDLKGWYEEEDVTFGDFVQKFGANLTKEQLKEVFDIHRKLNAFGPSVTYENCNFYTRKNAKITIGYVEFESQDMEVYSNYQYLGNQRFRRMKSDFNPGKYPNAKREERHYNVWYKFYYMPLLIDSITPNYNIQRQANYIYEFGKLQDQQREGDDYRYVKTSLTGYRNTSKMTWAEIIKRFMPKINFLWFKFQNEMVNAIPNGGFFAKKLIAMMAKSADEAGNNNETSLIEFMKKFKQTGWGLADPLLDEFGKIIGSGSPFMEFKNSMMLGAFENLDGALRLYNMMMQALSQNSITEGAGSKPRQNATGIDATITASDQAIFFITDPFSQVTKDTATKFLYYFKDIVDEGDTERFKEFLDIVGEASGEALATVKDIPYHNLGLDVENEMTTEQRQLVNDLSLKLASAGILLPEDVFFISSITDVKYAYAILCLKAKAGRALLMQEQQQQQQNIIDQKKIDLQIAQATIQSKQQAEAQNITLAKQWDFKIDQMINGLKGQIQTAIKQQVGQNKADEIITKSNVEKLNNNEPSNREWGLTESM